MGSFVIWSVHADLFGVSSVAVEHLFTAADVHICDRIAVLPEQDISQARGRRLNIERQMASAISYSQDHFAAPARKLLIGMVAACVWGVLPFF